MTKLIDLLIGIIVGFLICWFLFKPAPVQEIVIKEITRDSIIRDSIFIINDSIKEKIVYINKQYDKKVNSVMSSNDSVLMESFSGYIENYKRAIKNN